MSHVKSAEKVVQDIRPLVSDVERQIGSASYWRGSCPLNLDGRSEPVKPVSRGVSTGA